LVEIAAGLSQRCKVLFLDEPTAALTDSEAELLFAQIARLKAQGVGIVYVSHRMEEIRRISDRITVLRDGQLVATKPISEVSLDDIVRLMVGRELGEEFSRGASSPGETALRVDNLHRGPLVKDVSFEVRRGEILGFAGLMGSGRTETMRAIFGADIPTSGKVYVSGSKKPARIRSPKDAVRHGIALLTEDRKGQGLLLPLPISLNATITSLRRISVFGFLQSRREKHSAKKHCDALNVKLASLSQPVGDLSGGNQQKVVIAKWVYRNCDVLLFDEPTRGIDVGAKLEIYHLLDALTKEGKAVVVVSSDLKELLAISDRIAVMSAGKLAATFNRGEWTQDAIMAAALSGHLGSVPERNENG
jgi:ribose transport system ATP-binding protein